MEFIYIIKSYGKERDVYKIGYTKALNQRIESYISTNIFAELYSLFKIKNANVIEHQIHSNFKSDFKREWYSYETMLLIIDFLKYYNYEKYDILITDYKKIDKIIPITINSVDNLDNQFHLVIEKTEGKEKNKKFKLPSQK